MVPRFITVTMLEKLQLFWKRIIANDKLTIYNHRITTCLVSLSRFLLKERWLLLLFFSVNTCFCETQGQRLTKKSYTSVYSVSNPITGISLRQLWIQTFPVLQLIRLQITASSYLEYLLLVTSCQTSFYKLCYCLRWLVDGSHYGN